MATLEGSKVVLMLDELRRLRAIEAKAVAVVNASRTRSEKTQQKYLADLYEAILGLHAVCSEV